MLRFIVSYFRKLFFQGVMVKIKEGIPEIKISTSIGLSVEKPKYIFVVLFIWSIKKLNNKHYKWSC